MRSLVLAVLAVAFAAALAGAAAAQQGAGAGRALQRASDEAIEEGRARLAAAEREHGADAAATAQPAYELARLHFSRGELGEAEALARRATAILERADADGSVALADALLLTGACRANGNHHAEAVPLYARCLQLRERLLGEGNRHTMLALQNLYSSRMNSGEVAAGVDDLRELVARLERHYPGSSVLQTLRVEYVGTCSSLGRYAEALPQALARLAAARPAADEASVEVLRARRTVGHLLCRMTRLDEGLVQFDAVAAHLAASELPDDERCGSLAERAIAALTAGRADAEALGRAALAPARAPITGPQFACMISPLALLFAPPDERLELCEIGVAACERTLGESDLNTAAALANLAQVESVQDRIDEALAHATRALAILDRHPDSITPDRLAARFALALCEVRKGRAAAAVPHLQRNLDELPHLLHTSLPAFSDQQRMEYAAGARMALDLLVHVAVERGTNAENGLRGALAWKGTVARGLWQELRWLREQSGDGPQLQAELARLGEGTAAGAGASIDAGAFAARRTALTARLRALDREAASPTPELLAAALAADEVYVDFVVYDDWATPGQRCCAFVLEHGAVHLVDLGPLAPIAEALVAHLELCARSLRPAGAVGGAVSLRAARRLTELVWDALARFVGDARRVLVCPDGALATLPFATLRAADGSFLLEHHEFGYVAAGADLVAAPHAPRAAPGLCLVGDVDYGAAPAPTPTTAARSAFAPLAHSRGELDAVASAFAGAFPEPGAVTRLTGSAATASAFRTAAARADFLHIATHGFYSGSAAARAGNNDANARRRFGIGGRGLALPAAAGDRPDQLAGIALAGANAAAGGADDGVLTAGEIVWLDLHRCELVVLSACDTGLGTPSAGDSLIGLRRSLRLAGARRSLTTAWRVDDAATAELMATFYRELWKVGATPGAALRAAQLAMLAKNTKERGEALVATWGAFVLEGR